MPEFKNIAIVGPGLIGGSIGLVLKNKFNNKIKITGIGRNVERLKLAKKLKAIDDYSTNLISGIKNKDLVIICTPVEQIVDIIKKIVPYIDKNTLITDVGSVKGYILREVNKLVYSTNYGKNINFIGSHPIAGSDKTGIINARADLFNNSVCVICYEKNLSTKQMLFKLKKFWQETNSKTVLLNYLEHDKILAATSHLLHILAFVIVKQITKRKKYINFVGGAYKDMTRIANSSPELWSQICSLNSKFIKKELDIYINYLKYVKKIINKKNLLEKFFVKR